MKLEGQFKRFKLEIEAGDNKTVITAMIEGMIRKQCFEELTIKL